MQPPTLSVAGLASRLPGADQSLLNRRVRRWTDQGVLKPENGKRSEERKNRRYSVNEMFMMAIANKLMDARLDPDWLLHVMDKLRDALTKQEHAESWQAARNGKQKYLLIFVFPAPDNPEDMMMGVDIVDRLVALKNPDRMILLDLTETFRGLRK